MHSVSLARRILAASLAFLCWLFFGMFVVSIVEALHLPPESSFGFGGMAGALLYIFVAYAIIKFDDMAYAKKFAWNIGLWGLLVAIGSFYTYTPGIYAFGIGTMIGAIAIYFRSHADANFVKQYMRN